MTEPNMNRVFAYAKNAVALVANQPIPDAEIRTQLERILKEKDVVATVKQGLVTKEQGANLVLAQLESWTITRCGLVEPVARTWDLAFIAEDLESALFGG